MERAIEASTRLRAPLERARQVLRDDPGCLVTDGAGPQERREQRFLTPLATSVGTGAVSQDVEVEIGAVGSANGAVTVPFSWRPVAHTRLLPDFAGALVVERDELGNTLLSLRGTYDVPLGAVGRFGDTVVGRRLARHSVSDLLEQMAGRLDREVDRRAETTWHRPVPYPVDLRELHVQESSPSAARKHGA